MKYALVTPAKNEEAFIKRTLDSVVAQSIKPERWVIVSDGSTDRTDEIVMAYAETHSFIRLVRRDSARRNFGNKVHAFRAGYDTLHDVPYDFIGNLDADIELPPNYYEIILKRFAKDDKLGLCGGSRLDLCNGSFVEVHCAKNSVGGPFQLFRRASYEEIGGYRPLQLGGIDAVAEIMCRQKGWRVQSFQEPIAHHYRCTGTAKRNIYQAAFRNGKKLYVIGYHPLFEVLKFLKTKGLKGILLHGIELLGYTYAALKRYDHQVPEDFVAYLHQEQMDRMKSIWRRHKEPMLTTEPTP